MEDIRRCKKRGNRGLSWTSARQPVAKTVALGGGVGVMRRTALAWGSTQFGQFSARRGPLEVVKPWQARTFAAAELAPSMTAKSCWVQKPYTLIKGDGYYGSWES